MNLNHKIRIWMLLTGLVAGSFFISACEELLTEPTTEELLASDWQLLAVTVNGVSQPTADYRLDFVGGGNYTVQAPGMDIPNSGTWALNDTETAILLNGGAASISIVTVSETELVLTFTQENYKSEQVTFRFEFEKSV